MLVMTAGIVVAVLLVAWLASTWAEDGDLLDGADRLLTGLLAVTVGSVAMTAAVVGDLLDVLAASVAEAPGLFASAITGAIGSLAIGGWLELAPQAFAVLAIATVVGAFAVSEGGS